MLLLLRKVLRGHYGQYASYASRFKNVSEIVIMSFRLHRPAYQATFSVQNTGNVFGGEVRIHTSSLYITSDLRDSFKIPQLYLNFPASSGEPPSVLREFQNVELQPGEKQTVTMTLSRYDLSIWDVEKQGWRKPGGEIGVTVGASSRDGRLKGRIPV